MILLVIQNASYLKVWTTLKNITIQCQYDEISKHKENVHVSHTMDSSAPLQISIQNWDLRQMFSARRGQIFRRDHAPSCVPISIWHSWRAQNSDTPVAISASSIKPQGQRCTPSTPQDSTAPPPVKQLSPCLVWDTESNVTLCYKLSFVPVPSLKKENLYRQ
jgi:hypothetical protein